MNKALVTVSFGSARESTRAEIAQVEKQIAASYPDRQWYSAYSSNFMVNRIRRNGGEVATIDEIFEELTAQNYRDVFIQPIYVLEGLEYNRLIDRMNYWAGQLDSITLGRPLIDSREKLIDIGEKLKIYNEVKDDEVLLLFAHGSDAVDNRVYMEYSRDKAQLQNRRIYVAAIDGEPKLPDIISQMKMNGVSQVFVAPLMINAGLHVEEDMLGEDSKSWISQLKAAGISVRYSKCGLSQYKEIMAYLVSN